MLCPCPIRESVLSIGILEHQDYKFVEWAQDNLHDFERWVETGVPQLHPENSLPTFEQTSPV